MQFRKRPYSTRLSVEPLEDRRLLAVMSFQDGVLPSADYAGTRDVSLYGASEAMNFGDETPLRADAEQGSTGFPVWSLMKWDLSGIPEGATINDVSITVNVTNTSAAPGFNLLAMRTGWIEDQATWIGPTTDSTWEEPGVTDPSDFDPTVLGTMTGTATGPLSVLLNSAGRAVVAGWLADPASNHGLLIANPANENSLRFDSREGTTPANRPKLSIDFTFNDVDPPTAMLVDPLDNGPADEDPDTGEVRVGVRDTFVIGLDDFALDDTTVTAETLTLTKDAAPFADFTFAFDAATDQITLTPTAGSFGQGSYTVTLNGGDAKIADATGNLMPATTFTVVIDASLPTTPVAFPDDYQTAEDTPLTVDPDEGLLDNDFAGNAPGDAVLVSGPSNGALALNPDGSFTYTPAADFTGQDSFTYTLETPLFLSNVATATITVTSVPDPPIARDDEYGTPTGTPLAVPVAEGVLDNDTSVEGGAISARVDVGPEHGTLELSADGSLSYTPADGFSGADVFTYLANDGAADSLAATVTIIVNDPPTTEPDEYQVDQGGVLTVPIETGVLANDSDAAADTLTAALVSGPSSGELVLNSDGSLTYTPRPDFLGSDSFTYRAVDPFGATTQATVTINVVGMAPVAKTNRYTGLEDEPLIVDAASGVLANDVDAQGDEMTTVLSRDVREGSLTLNPDGSFTYTPNKDFVGQDSFRYRASDGQHESASTLVEITIQNVNDPPVAVDDFYTVAAGQRLVVVASYAANVLADEPVGYWRLGEQPGSSQALGEANEFHGQYVGAVTLGQSGAIADDDNTSIRFAPNSQPKQVDLGNPAELQITGQISMEAWIKPANITGSLNNILAKGWVPSREISFRLNAGAYSVAPWTGSPVSLGTSAPIPQDDLNNWVHLVGLYDGTHWRIYRNGVEIAASESSVGAVEVNANWTIGARSGGNERFFQGSIDEVAIYNRPLSANEIRRHYLGGIGFVGDELPAHLLKNDSDLDQDLLESILVDDARHGTLELSDDGSFTYTPDDGFVGTDTFTYVAADGEAVSNVATVSIKVNGAPVVEDDVYDVAEDDVLEVDAAAGVLSNDADPNGDTLRAVLVTGPAHGSVELADDGSFTYTPMADFFGDDTFTYRASDGIIESEEATVTIEVDGVGDVPVAVDDSYLTAVGKARIVAAPGVLVNDDDPDGDALRAVLVGDLENGSLVLDADGSFRYTPVENFVGVDEFKYRASDDENLSNIATVTVEVGPQSEAILAGDEAYSVLQDETLTVSGNVIAESGLNDAGGIGSDEIAGSPYTIGESVHLKGGGEVGWNGETWRVNVGGGDFGHDRARVVTSQVVEGDAAMFLDGASLGTWVHRRLPAEQSGRLRIEQHVQFTDLAGSFTSRPFGTSATPDEIGPQWTAENGKILVRDGDGLGGGAMLDTGFRWQPGQWHQVSLDVDVAAGTYELSFDGEKYESTSPLGFRGSPQSIREISYLSDKDAWVDRVRILSLEESDLPSVLENDANAAGDLLQTILVDGPEHGDLTFNPDGTFVYTPLAGLAASDQFTYRATNGVWVSNLATVTINNESGVPADLTGNGFVDFQDLTILLANWNQDVSAAEGNLVDEGGTPVNFQDLTVLLAAWTGPGGAPAPPAALATPVGRRLAAAQETSTDELLDSEREAPRQAAAYDTVMLKHNLRAGRRETNRSRSASGTYGRLQAAAVDRAMEDDSPRREIIARRRLRSAGRR
jgi:hypothetical protein